MLASLIGAFVSGEAANVARRARSAAIAYLSALIFFLCGAGFLVGAAYIAAARRFGSIEAAIGFGIGFILIGALILGIRAIAASMRKRRDTRRAFDLATIAGAAAVTALPLLLKRGGPGMLVPLAVAAVAYAVYRERRTARPDHPDKDDG